MKGSIKIINIIIKNFIINIKNKEKFNTELKLLSKYVQKSSLFIGEKKKIYKLIKKYVKK